MVIVNPENLIEAWELGKELTDEQMRETARLHELALRALCGCKHDVKEIEESGSSSSAVCSRCARDLGWYCPGSPGHVCSYDPKEYGCVYCGEPEERK